MDKLAYYKSLTCGQTATSDLAPIRRLPSQVALLGDKGTRVNNLPMVQVVTCSEKTRTQPPTFQSRVQCPNYYTTWVDHPYWGEVSLIIMNR